MIPVKTAAKVGVAAYKLNKANKQRKADKDAKKDSLKQDVKKTNPYQNKVSKKDNVGSKSSSFQDAMKKQQSSLQRNVDGKGMNNEQRDNSLSK